MNALFPNLEALILAKAPPHRAVPKAPENLAQLNEWAAFACHGEVLRPDGTYGVGDIRLNPYETFLPVWDGASESTIYSSPEVNYAYRAWHDWLHLKLQADVHYSDEYRVSCAHWDAAVLAGIPDREVQALWFDSHGQNEYHKEHGDFVKDQRGFVLSCLEIGLYPTIRLKIW